MFHEFLGSIGFQFIKVIEAGGLVGRSYQREVYPIVNSEAYSLVEL